MELLAVMEFCLGRHYRIDDAAAQNLDVSGSMLSFLGLLYALYIIARTIMYGADVPGYASLLVFILLVGGVQMIILGILGEYIGRIFIEVKRRPLYIVEKKVNLDDDE